MGWTMINSMFAISAGAAAGAVLRWLLGISLNALFAPMPPGTLAANLIGGYLMGIALAVFAGRPGLAPKWRLLIITGFLGGLTTFSSFSAEVTMLIQERQTLLATAAMGAHVMGSLLMTVLGLASVTAFRRI